MERYIQTSVETPDRQAENSDRPGNRRNVFSILGTGLTSLLAALIIILVVARIFPTQHAFWSLGAYLPLHTAMETFAIVVSMLVFAVGWNINSRQDAGNIILLSCAFLAVGLLDFAHTLSFPGMPGFVTPSSPGKAIDFWLPARGLAALALLAAAVRPWQPFVSPLARHWLLAAALGITALVYWTVLFHQDELPDTFIADRGLTSFKIGAEYALIAIYGLAAAVFLIRLRIRHAGYLRKLFAACCVAALSELFFTFYLDVTDIYNLLGHAYKVIAYFLIYKALFVHGIGEPQRQLHQFQHALQENKERFKSLVQLSSDWYWEQDTEFRFTFMSGGLSMIGKRRWDFPVTGVSTADWERHKLTLEHHLPFHDFTYQITGKHQGKRWFSVSGVPIFDDQGHFKGYRGTGRDVTELKTAEAEIRLARERLRLALEGSSLAQVDVDVANGKIYLSAAWAAMLGDEPAATVTSFEELMKLTHPAESEWIKKHYYDALTGRIPVYDLEHRVMTRSGEWKWIRSHGKVVARDSSGRVVRMAGTNMDITERKQAELRLQMEHAVTRVLSESEHLAAAIPEIIQAICETLGWDCGARWDWDEKRQFLRCAETWSVPDAAIGEYIVHSSQLTFAANHGGLLRRVWLDNKPVWVSDIARDPTFQRGPQAIKAGLHGAFAFPVMAAGKSIGVMEFFSRDIRKPDDTLLNIGRSIGAQIGQFIQRIQAEHARRESEARLSGIVETSMRAIIVVDEDMNIVLFNPAAERIFGYRSGDITGARLDRLIPERFRGAHHQHMKMFGSSETTVRVMDARGIIMGLRANGEEFPAEASISHLAVNGKKLYTATLADITERLETEKTLRLSSEVFETSNEGIIVSDASNRIVSVNPAFTTITGYTPDEVIGKSPSMLSSGLQDAEFYRNMWTSINKTGRWEGEVWDRRKNGEIFCERLSISTVKNPRGEIVYHTAIFYDITEWKRTEQALHASETEMRLVTDNLPAMISCFDENLHCRFINKRYLEVFGFSGENLLGKHLQEIIGEAGYQKIKDRFDKALKGHPVTYQRTQQLPTGESRDMETTLVPHVSEQGKIVGCYALTTDITERKQAEAARAGLAAIVESSHDAIISRGLDGRILSWNAGAAHMLGYSPEEAIGQPMAMIVPPDRQHVIASNTEQLRRGEMIPAFETQRRHKDGRMIEVWSAISPIRNDAGEVIGSAAIFRDVSQLKRAERELRRKAALTELLEALARAANEATTPETALQACLERICAYGHWTLGHVVLYAPDQSSGVAQTSFWHGQNQALFNEFIRYSNEFSYGERARPGYGQFVGVALRERRPVWIEDISKADGSNRLTIAFRFGIRAAFVFPVVVGRETAAFLEFFAEDVRECDTLLLDAIGSVASQLARLIERSRAEVERGQLAAIVENSNDAIISRTLDGMITSWNAAAQRMLGYSASEAIGQPISLIWSPGWPSNVKRNTEKLLGGEIVAPHESQRVTKDGRVINVLASISPIRSNAGEIVGAAVILQDISALKQAEAARARLASIIESSNDAIISRTFDGTITSWNAGAERLFGYSAGETIGKLISFNSLPGRVPVFPKMTERVLSGEVIIPHETQRLTKDGQVIDVLSSISPIRNDAGEIVAISSIFQDISALRQAQAAVKQSEERFRAAFEQVGVGMALREFDQLKPRWLRVNQKLCAILGYTRDELMQLTFFDVTLPEDRGATIDYNAQLLRGAISNYSCEKRYVRKDGQIIWANITLSAVSGPDGRQNHIISVIEDITAQKRAEERILSLNAELEQRVMERTRQLEATNKELEAFSYSVSHDLRAPLRGIDGFSQMLLKKYADHLDETASDYLQRIRRASMRMGELIDDMLQLSRVSGSEVRTEAVDLSQLARSILETLRETEPQRAVETEVQDGVVITGDVRLLKIALENLLANAWKFTGKKKHAKIRFGSRKQDGERVVFVKDNGAGFNMKYAHKLFGAFQRLHGMTEFEGTGIGLATVQRIMNLHGGRIWANAAIEKGATFYFTIPRSAPDKMTTP